MKLKIDQICVHDRRVYLCETCIILICIYRQMLYIVSVASACDVSYLYTSHLFCSCIYILIPLCYSCDVSCLNLFYFCLIVFMYYPQRHPLPIIAADRTCYGASIRVWREVGRLTWYQSIGSALG